MGWWESIKSDLEILKGAPMSVATVCVATALASGGVGLYFQRLVDQGRFDAQDEHIKLLVDQKAAAEAKSAGFADELKRLKDIAANIKPSGTATEQELRRQLDEMKEKLASPPQDSTDRGPRILNEQQIQALDRALSEHSPYFKAGITLEANLTCGTCLIVREQYSKAFKKGSWDVHIRETYDFRELKPIKLEEVPNKRIVIFMDDTYFDANEPALVAKAMNETQQEYLIVKVPYSSSVDNTHIRIVFREIDVK